MALSIILLLLCYLQLILTSVEGSLCSGKCQCSYQPDGGLKVQCDNNNYTNFISVSALPEDTEIISFRNNRIHELPNQPVGNIGSSVWFIDLSVNNIEGILEDKLGKAFPNLSHLDLSNNLIWFLSNSSFQHSEILTVLYLSNNNLRILNQEWFSYLLELSHLYMNDNKITSISITSSGWPTKLSTLDLSDNELKIIPPLPVRASRVNLSQNPVYCGCHLDVNKNISETFIKVECYHLSKGNPQSLSSRLPHMIERHSKFVKYRSEGPKCQSVKITDFSYLVDKGKWLLNCITTYGYPDVTIHIYHEEREIMKSKLNISLVVKEAGIYTCKVTNYISHDQQWLNITSDNDFNQTTFRYKSEITSTAQTDQPNTNDYQGKDFSFFLYQFIYVYLNPAQHEIDNQLLENCWLDTSIQIITLVEHILNCMLIMWFETVQIVFSLF